MKLQQKIPLVNVFTIFLSSILIITISFLLINNILLDYNKRLLTKELDFLMKEIKDSHQVLVDSGVDILESYILQTQEQLFEEFNRKKFDNQAYLYIVNSQHKIVFHPVLTKGSRVEYDFIDEMLKTHNGEYSYVYESKKRFTIFRYFENWDWIVALALTDANLYETSYFYLFVISGITLIIIILTSILTFLSVKRFVFKPINLVTAKIKELAEGQGNLTSFIDSKKGNDEISFQIGYLNQFISFLNGMIKNIMVTTAGTSASSQNLKTTSQVSLAALGKINEHIIQIKNKAVTLDNDVRDSNQLVNNIKEFIQNLTLLIAEQSSSIDESSSAIEQMNASIQNISNMIGNKEKITNDLKQITSNGKQIVEENVTVINNVAESTVSIMELLKSINKISSQTNLLAMNAAIEAAHAGDAGKGFSVVAEEIRTLAGNTASNSKQISIALKAITEKVTASKVHAQKTGDFFTHLTTGIIDVADSMAEVKNAVIELANGSREIIIALTALLQITTDIKGSSNEVNEKIGKVAAALDRVALITNDTRNSVEEINLSIANIFQSFSQVTEIQNQNMENIDQVEGLLKKFTV